jgi:uncharacterized protein (TIGR03086 family)
MQTIIDLRPLHRRALDVASKLIATIGPADLARPTPCTGWDLRALLEHAIGQNHGFAAAVEGPDAPVSAYAGRPFEPEDVEAKWTESAERLATAFAAAPLDRPILLAEFSAEQRFPVAMVVSFQLLDTVVHTWDIATALGQAFRPDDELAAATLAVAERVPTGEAREQPGAPFGPALRYDGSDDWTRALALLGRR